MYSKNHLTLHLRAVASFRNHHDHVEHNGAREKRKWSEHNDKKTNIHTCARPYCEVQHVTLSDIHMPGPTVDTFVARAFCLSTCMLPVRVQLGMPKTTPSGGNRSRIFSLAIEMCRANVCEEERLNQTRSTSQLCAAHRSQ